MKAIIVSFTFEGHTCIIYLWRPFLYHLFMKTILVYIRL